VLFDSLDAGFCVTEVRFAEGELPADYRVLEANPAFARHTGLTDVVGRWIREAVPEIEEHWIEIYAHVAETGESVRFEQGSQALEDAGSTCSPSASATPRRGRSRSSSTTSRTGATRRRACGTARRATARWWRRRRPSCGPPTGPA
jgi:PAS domain-containing protein